MLFTQLTPLWLCLASLGASTVNATPISRTHSSPLLSPKALASLESFRTRYGMQSYNLAIVGKSQDGKWQKEAYGLGALDANGTKVDDQSLYALGSNSKLFTVLSIGMLIDNCTVLPTGGKLSLETKMKDIFPEWSLIDKNAEANMTLHHIMSMTSGIPRHDMSHGDETPAETVKLFAALRPSAPLGNTYQYSNGHYFVVSAVVSALSGVPFIDYVKQHILDPLCMDQSFYNATEALATGHRAEGFFRQEIDKVACAKGWNKTSSMGDECIGKSVGMGWWVDGDGVNEAGAGGISSSARDQQIWLQELLEPKVLSAEWIKKAYEPVISTNVTMPGPEMSGQMYGMGQWTYTYRGVKIVEHGGGVPGFTSLHLRIPSRNLAFVIATNDGGPAGIMYPSAWLVFDNILGLEPINWEDRLVISSMKLGPSAVELTPLPKTPVAPSPVDTIVGHYNDVAYGDLNLTQILTPTDANFNASDPISAMLANLKKYPPGPVNLADNSPIYVAKVDKVFSSYLIFTHFDGPAYIWTNVIVKAIPGDKEGRFAFFNQGLGQAVIMPGKGVGMYGNFWGGQAGKVPTGKADPSVESEVWFKRA